MSEWISQSQAAALWDVSERTVRNWVRKTSIQVETMRVHPYTFYRYDDLNKVREEAEKRWGFSGSA